MDYHGMIILESGKRGGRPCIRGSRITVYEVLELLASGMTPSEIVEDFPELTETDIYGCLSLSQRTRNASLNAQKCYETAIR